MFSYGARRTYYPNRSTPETKLQKCKLTNTLYQEVIYTHQKINEIKEAIRKELEGNEDQSLKNLTLDMPVKSFIVYYPSPRRCTTRVKTRLFYTRDDTMLKKVEEILRRMKIKCEFDRNDYEVTADILYPGVINLKECKV